MFSLAVGLRIHYASVESCVQGKVQTQCNFLGQTLLEKRKKQDSY